MTIVSDDSLVMSSGQLENVYGFGYENEFWIPPLLAN
jgi:hypothetical protein